MNAKEARQITEKSLRGTVIEPFLVAIYDMIKSHADKGKSSIINPLYTMTMKATGNPTPEMTDAIYHRLTADGYKVIHYPDPDPGHPCSSPYTEISWKDA